MIVLQNKPSDKDFLFNEMLLLLDNCLAGQKHLTITVFPENGQAFLLQPRPIKDFVNLSSNKDQNKISTISKKFRTIDCFLLQFTSELREGCR